jgi:hypothetical protein
MRPHVVGLLVFSLLCACARVPASAPAPSPESGLGAVAWDRLKAALPGSWSMPGKAGPFVVSYRLISGGSVLVEEWGPGTPHETETVFHPDHADLLLTHYCAQGNQPRLRVAEVTADTVVFRFVDVTNRGPDQSMLVERTLRLGGEWFDDTEVYVAPDGTRETTTYRFTRAPSRVASEAVSP